MNYQGRYKIFPSEQIKTYPVSERQNKVKLADLVTPAQVWEQEYEVPEEIREKISELAAQIVEFRQTGKPVVLFTGAHLIKNGLGPLLVDLVRQDAVSLVAGNAATAIHDFELALIGETSEHVPNALGKGEFGMAYEFAYHNEALKLGNNQDLGYGESLGRMICDEKYRDEVLQKAAREESPRVFMHSQLSVLATCYKYNVPFTVHAGIGTDVIDQHPSFDGQAKGGCSGRDFLIYANEVCKFTEGGLALNIGSAVQGPEVLLKAVSMAANIGCTPNPLNTADFDIRPFNKEQMTDESQSGYYNRDQKSVVTRAPEAFHGTGLYIEGNQKQTFPLLYREIIKNIR
ncbi:hypothetical protein ACFL2B_02705 [Patescibacteria group bacterium]